jgi:hypothetical protein
MAQTKGIPFSERPFCSVNEALEATSFGRTKFYELLNAGTIESVMVDGRRLVVVPSLIRLGRTDEGRPS